MENNKQTPTNVNDGVQPAAIDKVERAEQAVRKMEDAEKRLDEKIAKLQELEANRLLGSSAGSRIETPQLTEEETKKKEAIDFWKGTAIADAIAKNG